MKDALATLRDRSIPAQQFREASRVVCEELLTRLAETLQAQGLEKRDIVLVFVLRAALAFLEPSLAVFPEAKVGFAGLRRNEDTAVAEWYYERFPSITPESVVIICDPMLATGGSAHETVRKLLSLGAASERIYYVGVIGAPEGLQKLRQHLADDHILLSALDPQLDARKFIVPGLGDFGDRYFGTV